MDTSTRVGKYRYRKTKGGFMCIKETKTAPCKPKKNPECEICDAI